MEDEKPEQNNEKQEQVVEKQEQVVAEGEKPEQNNEKQDLPVYKEKLNKILCDFCNKALTKSSISKHRKTCKKRPVNEEGPKPEAEPKPEAAVPSAINIVPVTQELESQPAEPQPPAPLKLERNISKAKRAKSFVKEVIKEESEPESDGYEKAVAEPVEPVAMKTFKPTPVMTRVDKMRMLARSGLPK